MAEKKTVVVVMPDLGLTKAQENALRKKLRSALVGAVKGARPGFIVVPHIRWVPSPPRGC